MDASRSADMTGTSSTFTLIAPPPRLFEPRARAASTRMRRIIWAVMAKNCADVGKALGIGGAPTQVSEARPGAPASVALQPTHRDDAAMNGAPGIDCSAPNTFCDP